MYSQIVSLLILAVVIVLFVSRLIPNALAAVLGCALFVLFGVCSIEEAFSGFSNSIVILMFGMMVVGLAVSETGLTEIIGQKVIRISRNSERLFILMTGTTAAALSTFLSNSAVIAILIPLLSEISQSDKRFNRMDITLPVAIAAIYGGVCTLIGSTPQLAANGILSEMTGTELGMFAFTLPGVLLFVAYMLFVMLIGYPLGKRIWGDRPDVRTEDVQHTESGQTACRKKRVIVSIILILIVISFVGGWLEPSMTAVLGAILCVLTGCISYKNISKKMDWSVVFMLAGCLGIAVGITKGGAADMLGDFLTEHVGSHLSPRWILAVFAIVTMVVSNFINNTSTVAITLPIALALCVKQGLNPSLFTMAIVFASSLAYSSPLANAHTAMTLVAGYRFSDYIRYTWILNIVVLLAIIFLFPLLMPLCI